MQAAYQASKLSIDKLSSRLVALLTLILIVRSSVGKGCPTVSGLNSPISILQAHVNGLLKWLSPQNTADQVSLVMFNEQKIDSIVYRYIFKVTTEAKKTYYIGVLSQITSETLKSSEPVHNVIRFIQSADLRDAQRLLGIYDLGNGTEDTCTNLKEEFSMSMRQKGLNYNGQLLTSIEEAKLKAISNLSSEELLHIVESRRQAATKSSQLPQLHGLVSHAQDGTLISTLHKLLAVNNIQQGNISNNGPKNQSPLLKTNPAASKRKTSYTIGTVLSGTGKDKIFQKSVNDDQVESARLLQTKSESVTNKYEPKKKRPKPLKSSAARPSKHYHVRDNFPWKRDDSDDDSSFSTGIYSREKRMKKLERNQKDSRKEFRHHANRD